MKYQPHPLRRADDPSPSPSVRRPPAGHEEIGHEEITRRAIADVERSFSKVRDELRRLAKECATQSIE